MTAVANSKKMKGDISGVRIIPPKIEFTDVELNVIHRAHITVKNISKVSKSVRYYGPQSKEFTLQVRNPEIPIAAGLEVPAVVEYCSSEKGEHKDRLVLTVDGDVIEIPVIASPCKPALSIEGPVDFGHMVAGSRVITRKVLLYNNGTKEGEFKIKYAGEKPISFIPSSGSVPMKSVLPIKVEYVTKVPGEFNEYAKVKLEGQDVSYLQVQGSVVEGALYLLSPDLEEILECVDFGCSYYGTDRTESAVLYNCGPEPISFVTVLDENAIGQEVGVDLTKSTSAMLIDGASNGISHNQDGEVNDLKSLVTAIPNQGVLGPYEKMPIFFRFSPRWHETGQGFKIKKTRAPRKDFAVFINIKVVGASAGIHSQDSSDRDVSDRGQNLEIALTATAVPVMLALNPMDSFDFGGCPSGDRRDILCTLTNESSLLPVSYQFRRIAHFTVKPSKSKILPGHSQELVFCFAPRQAGTFKTTQLIDVMGTVADNRNPFLMNLQVIHSIPISFTGKSDPPVTNKCPVFNPGITPKITNEVGLNTDVMQSALANNPRAAILSSQGSKLHKHKVSKDKENEKKTLVAFPNDRASSIRPSNRKENYRTVFTHIPRHTFVDPDYTYTDEQAAALETHKQYYKDFIQYLRERRLYLEKTKEFEGANNSVDIGIQPAAGLKPKKLHAAEAWLEMKAPQPPNGHFQLLSMNDLAASESVSAAKLCDGLNAVPTTAEEKEDCKKILSPVELHRVTIGPPTIDFKQVCLRSMNQKEVTIINNLDKFTQVVLHIDCQELRQTAPLSQVIPPRSRAVIPIIFESAVKGKFQRSVDYVINGFYKNHLNVFAEVVPVALELSSEEIVVEPTVGLPAEAGIRGVVTLRNKLNLAAEFTWTPILGERGTAFSIRPATGVVDAYSNLDCEIVFHPSFMAPEESMFALQVHRGNTVKLKCAAKLGTSSVQFVDRRVVFGQVPLHLESTRVALIRNNGIHHVYFQVVDPSPFPGLQVSPLHGVIPVGGTADLAITLTPNAVIKFDTRIQVAIRGGKTLELRMSGAVEPPHADIDVASFNFGGVYCGSEAVTNFRLKNLTNAKAKMEFDLARYSDFTMKFPGFETPEDFTMQLLNPGVYSVTLEPNEVVEGEVYFRPTEVASYDFVIPVTMNQTGAPSPANSPMPPTPGATKNRQNNFVSKPIYVNVVTPSRKVVATALRQPLQISSLKFEFIVSPEMQEMVTSSGISHLQTTTLLNRSDRAVQWALDLTSKDVPALEDGVFKFLHASGTPFLGNNGEVSGSLDPGQTFNLAVSFCPKKPGFYEAAVPLIINQEWDRPFTQISVTGLLKSPKITFDPLAIVLTPTPLDTPVTVVFRMLTFNYTKKSSLQVEVPQVEGEDGSILSPLSVTFLDDNEINPESDGLEEPNALRCSVTFASARPVSFSSVVKFIDDMNNVFTLPVTATADNCLLTCYPFLAQHRTDHQIVCEQGTSLKGRRTASNESINVGEAVLLPCGDPHRSASRPSTTATSSNFEVSSSSYESGSQSMSDSSFPETPRDGALNKFTTESEQHSRSTKQRQDLASRSLGSAVFPEEDTEEGIFHAEVLLAVQRWFSAQGWPTPNPIFIPHSLRSGLSKKPNEAKAVNAKGGTWEANNLKKEFKTVYDMITHLCGKQIPGIPSNGSLPDDSLERAKQIHWQHSTLLTFLKSQGACVASIKPEYLMELQDYKVWVLIQRQIDVKKARKMGGDIAQKTEEEEALEDQLFEAVSKRAWTDVLLQVLKVLVLSKVTPRKFRSIAHPYNGSEMPMVDPNPLCSNVYSVSERILLLWLNHNYEQNRRHIWQDSPTGGVPPSRWIVNFDFDLLDGLVLASVIAAHAPFLIPTHLGSMFTQPTTAEQCLHNALKVVRALHFLGIEYDIQAIDITDPNPVSLLLLCHHLYENLPQYLPQANVEFVGGLHQTALRQVKLSNPSTKSLTYTAMLAGKDAQDFSLPRGSLIELSPKSTVNVPVEFISRFLRPASAVLVLVGRRQGSNTGTTLVFTLTSLIDNISPKSTIRCEAPCYEIHKISLSVMNPFARAGDFKIIVVENQAELNEDAVMPFAPSSGKGVDKKPSRRGRSKMNRGPQSDPEENQEEGANRQPVQEQDMQSFHCATKTTFLEARETGSVEVEFLPFQLGKRQCLLVFTNNEVGEFIYAIEATATLPKPTNPPQLSTSSVQISTAAAADKSLGSLGGQDDVILWRCEVGQTLKETIPVPVLNEAAEQALLAVAQQNMTEVELHRRRVTGTLECATVTTQAVERLSTSAGPRPPAKPRAKETTFVVELDSKQFSAPKTLTIPLAANRTRTSASLRPSSTNSINLGVPQQMTVDLPVTFHATDAGQYACKVVLTSQDDVRVYNIECIVVAPGSDAELEFTSPIHQSVTQDIPVVNQTTTDWLMEATIDGSGFTGPTNLLAKAYSTTFYPLIFRPQKEGTVQGHLVLRNTCDGVKQRFTLKGTGEAPLPLEQLVFHAQVKQSVQRTLQIPNITRKKLCYKVSSDLPFISGPEYVTVLPGKSVSYPLNVNPNRHGHYRGVLSFVAGPGAANQDDITVLEQVDSDGEEMSDGNEDEEEEFCGYTVWYSLEAHVSPAAPEKAIAIKCPCQKQMAVEVGFTNPTDEEITLDVEIQPHNVGLRGSNQFRVKPKERGIYQLLYGPAVIGGAKGSLIFYSPAVGEFWYNLELEAEKPVPTQLPHMECELGRWVRQYITLNNPTDEMLSLFPTISNNNNFVLERDNEMHIELGPHSSLKLPLTFMPSNLGPADHRAMITFHCEQLGEWTYFVSGSGRLPQPQDPVSVTALAGSNSTMILPFRNPLDETVIADVIIKDKEGMTREALDNSASPGQNANEPNDSSPFCLLMKHHKGVRVGPKNNFDIPVSFAPQDMKMSEAVVLLSVKRENGEPWKYDLTQESNHVPESSVDAEVGLIEWQFPIKGYPELLSTDTQPAVVQCQARERLEERLEVSLTGVAPATGGPKRGIKKRAKSGISLDSTPNSATSQTGVVVGESIALAQEFSFEMVYKDEESKRNLDSSVALSLVRQERDRHTGLVILVFNVIYAPYKPMSHDVQLLIKGATGGIWKFQLRFQASEPEPDDCVTIEALGLNKESSIGFRLTSQAKHPVPYSAFFIAGSDPEFAVSPNSGELLPIGTNGTLIKVLFCPQKYGKLFQGKLVVQTADMQWTYNVRGVLPDYIPPRGNSSGPLLGPHPDPRVRHERVNFIRENMRLTTTAVSSPMKGAPLMPRIPSGQVLN